MPRTRTHRGWLSPRPYLGFVATRPRICGEVLDMGAGEQFAVMSRTYHYARDEIRELWLAWTNWYVDTGGGSGSGSGELGSGSTWTITMSVEYPEGTFTQCRFNGGSTSAAVTSGSTQWTDPVRVAIPRNAKFFVRMYWAEPAGAANLPINSAASNAAEYMDEANGDAIEVDGADKTLSGTVTGIGIMDWVGPSAIIGQTTRPSFAIIGDSKFHGVGDIVVANVGDMGEAARSIGRHFAYVNAALGADNATGFLASNTRRLALLRYASHLLTDIGGTDVIFLGTSTASAQPLMQAVWQLFAPRTVIIHTWTPYTSSTDGWITTGNQTREAESNDIDTMNDWMRTRPVGCHRVCDTSDAMSTSRNSGIWIAPSGVAQTYDGVHCTPAGYTTLQNSLANNPAFIPQLQLPNVA